MSDIDRDTLNRQRLERHEKMERLFRERETTKPRERLMLLGEVLNSLIDEHNAITEPEACFDDKETVIVRFPTLDALDAWYDGGDIMDLLTYLNHSTPYDPSLICGCLPQRPD